MKRNGEVVIDLAERIKAAILAGTFRPGEPLPEAHVIQQFGCSRASAREALRLVTHSGLAAKAPNQSYRIVQFDAGDLNELTSLRLILEQQAARFAFGQESMIEGMGTALEHLRTAVANGDRTAAIRANRDFHQAIIDSSGHRRLAQAYLQISDQIEFAFLTLNHLRRSLDRLVPEHETLYECARTGTPEAFLVELGNHIHGVLAAPPPQTERPPTTEMTSLASLQAPDILEAKSTKVGQLRW